MLIIKKTVSQVMKGFEKTIADLRLVAEKNEGENMGYKQTIKDLSVKIEDNAREINQANAIADKLEALING